MKFMKFFIVAAAIIFTSCKLLNIKHDEAKKDLLYIKYDKENLTNNFYDNEETIDLKFNGIDVTGEVQNPGMADLSVLPLHTVIVKEAILANGKDTFVGAYRYHGYSLFDILNKFKIKDKANNEFNSVINYFVEIENARGEKAVLSWGEIYYPAHLNEIIIATKVMRIIPSKTKEMWPLPTESKLVVAGDLITERNISYPTKITVLSFPKNLPDKKGLKPLFSESFKLFNQEREIAVINDYPKAKITESYPCVFYGRGKGIHGINTFEGIKLKDALKDFFSFNKENLQNGLFLIAGIDGFRAVYSFSEIFNRNDQADLLLIDSGKNDDGGRFKCFPAGDFFSDRAIKAISEIDFILAK
jgi:hypothetical protein